MKNYCSKKNYFKSNYVILFFQIQVVTQIYEQLQDLNFELEVEHFTSLQDIDILDNQVHKYQILLKSEEVALHSLAISLLDTIDKIFCLCSRVVVSCFFILKHYHLPKCFFFFRKRINSVRINSENSKNRKNAMRKLSVISERKWQ